MLARRSPPLGSCVEADLLLLQGVVESRTLEDNRGLKYTMVLFSRRSRLHPGMRYIARGLNSLASPGNEIECEQVLLNPAEWPAAYQLVPSLECSSSEAVTALRSPMLSV